MTKQEIIDLDNEIITMEELEELEESEFVTEVEKNGYSGLYYGCLMYTVTVEEEEITIYIER